MNIKTYHASTMKEALDLAKSDLGGDAVILHTRCLRKGGIFGFGGREVVELTASTDVRVLPRGPGAATATAPPPEAPPKMIERAYAPPVERGALEQGHSVFHGELKSIKNLLTNHLAGEQARKLGNVSEELTALYRIMLRRSIHPTLARGIIKRLKGGRGADKSKKTQQKGGSLDKLRRTIESMIKTAPPIEPTGNGPLVVALIGPTGVGKTTTIAKLAANFKLVQGYEVGLVSLDTYRIAAVQQLKTYADIIGIPVNVILTPEELSQAREAFADKDIVLVDTAGRSQRDAKKMGELKVFLEAGMFDQTHLVVSATTGESSLDEIMEHFAPLAGDQIILSKMDEAACPGHILRIALESDKRLSYLTTGQEVPDDIEPADAKRFTAMILGEEI